MYGSQSTSIAISKLHEVPGLFSAPAVTVMYASAATPSTNPRSSASAQRLRLNSLVHKIVTSAVVPTSHESGHWAPLQIG